MSHTTNIQAAPIDNLEVLQMAAEFLRERGKELTVTGHGSNRLYDGTTAEGLWFQPQGWRYGVCAKPDGTLLFDDYGGSWGKEAALDEAVAAYHLCGAMLTADMANQTYNFWEDEETYHLEIEVASV